MERPTGQSFVEWLDSAFSTAPSEDVIAFCLNLYDAPFRADIIGAGQYDPKDPDWACTESWRPSGPPFDFPADAAGLAWEKRLALARQMLKQCLDTPGPAAKRLREAQVLAVAFVDGDLEVIYTR